ncbi:unnamed protein product [Calicophoron daubneyi]|uniref:Legumain prodomain domain-containing protein n=1 Tax=Calicophoron daubneyi TaxID=300641 RepID=A0AAV2T9G2_CALDB
MKLSAILCLLAANFFIVLAATPEEETRAAAKRYLKELEEQLDKNDAIRSDEAHFVPIIHKIRKAKSEKERKEAEAEFEHEYFLKKSVEDSFKYINRKVKQYEAEHPGKNIIRNHLERIACYKEIHQYFSARCSSIKKTPYVLSNLVLFDEMCTRGVNSEVVNAAIDEICK